MFKIDYRRHAVKIIDGRLLKMGVTKELKSTLEMADNKTLQKIYKKAIYLLQQDTLHTLKVPSVCPPAAHHKR